MTRKVILFLLIFSFGYAKSCDNCNDTIKQDTVWEYAKMIFEENLFNNSAFVEEITAEAERIAREVIVPQMAQNMEAAMMQFQQTLVSKFDAAVEERVDSKVDEIVQEQVKIKVEEIKPQIEQEVLARVRVEQSQTLDTAIVNEIKERLETVEELGKLQPVRHCQDLADQGVKTNGFYFGDPDGNGLGLAPIQMECDFDRNVTKIHHNFEASTEITRCDEPGCAQYDLSYPGSIDQIQTLISLSQECSQEIRFDCNMAPLRLYGKSLGWWKDINGISRHFFNGNYQNENTCTCANDGICLDPSQKCNCDANENTWTSDIGYITNVDMLPISSFHYGPLEEGLLGKKANFTIGSLECTGSTSEFVLRKEISGLKSELSRIDNSVSDLSDEINNSVSDLNNNVDESISVLSRKIDTSVSDLTTKIDDSASDISVKFDNLVSNLPTKISAHIEDKTVYFQATIDRNGSILGKIKFDRANPNIGGGMDAANGVFTAPQNGYYHFTFSGQSSGEGNQDLYIHVVKNDQKIFEILEGNRGMGNIVTHTWIKYLNTGDELYLKVVQHKLYSDSTIHTHFSGFLL